MAYVTRPLEFQVALLALPTRCGNVDTLSLRGREGVKALITLYLVWLATSELFSLMSGPAWVMLPFTRSVFNSNC